MIIINIKAIKFELQTDKIPKSQTSLAFVISTSETPTTPLTPYGCWY